jgi:F-type H+-transporting ATPase subunit gamma
VTGVKFTRFNYFEMRNIIERCDGINMINGPDEMLVCGLTMGADAGIGSTYNIMPGRYVKLFDAFQAGELDVVYLAYTRFLNTMKQEPVLEQLLPLSGEQLRHTDHGWDYLYEPDARAVIDELLLRYVEALVYQSVAENMASEQSARMVAMKAASDNAGNVINELQLVYNKTRPAAITKELSEIVGGAAAV